MGKGVDRLYDQIHPDHYDLAITLDIEEMSFEGTEKIYFKKVGRPSKRLTFHQKDLKIISASIKKIDKKGSAEIKITRINKQSKFDEVRFHTEDFIYPGNYELQLEYSGKITRPMNGIYPCYFKHDNKDKVLIATQFESHHAREAFICVDEPEAKATFDLKVLVPTSDPLVANTPVKKVEELVTGGKKLFSTTFETTPKMSTYLLAFVYGEMKYLEATTKDGVVVRTYATPDNVKHTEFALDCAVKTLDFYNQYFDIPYPLKKCDFIALPDFASGAMENWGCITFREQALIVDPANTSLNLKQFVADVVAHELTHQWFGNLVTMRWWTDLWLNESFATWMSWLALDELFPDWKVWTQFIVDEQSIAMKLDALEYTHPIEVEVKHPDEIRTIFDSISYEKGASVLLMLHKYLGADAFREGLRLYLKRHAYGNTDTLDLWSALEEVSKKPIKEFMSSWTSQPGYPIVKFDGNNLTQERFYLNPNAQKKDSLWPIPLLSDKLSFDTLDKSSKSVDTSDIIILNQGRSSFFRSIYGQIQLDKILDEIRNKRLGEIDRLGFLSDASEAAKAGYSSSVDVLKILDVYRDEDSTVVWDIIANTIGSIRVVMEDDALRESLKTFVRELSAKQLKRLGWEEKTSDSYFDKLLRPTILGLSSFGEDPSVVEKCVELFEKMKSPEDLHPDIRGVVYGTVCREGGRKEFDKMIELHDKSQSSEEKVTLASAITGFEQPELIEKALTKIRSDEVRIQDVGYWIAYVFMNRHAKDIAWEWLKDNWEWLYENMGTDLSFFRMPNYVARNYYDTAFLPEFKDFFERQNSPAYSRPINQAVETIQWQAAWRSRDFESIKDYLRDSK